jgi:hypothetical protein
MYANIFVAMMDKPIKECVSKTGFDWILFANDLLTTPYLSEGKFLVAKFEFGGSFGMSLKGDCHDVEVTPYLELLVNFDMSLEGVCHELCT